ncbi:MAG: ImmA/IrrE family metallo-endopeptidase [Bacilli bacterium]|nr:ImmA/IrrE family metallo-endopeptidase [Bacilli bacterium]
MYYLSGKEYDEIVKEVINLYEDYVLNSFPIDVKALATAMGFVLKPYSSLQKEERGFLLQKEETKNGFHVCDISKGYPKYTICYNDLDQEPRWRHTIAHEIGHIVLKHGSNPTKSQEAAADYFAKQLLALSCIIIEMGLGSVEEIVYRFNISWESAFYTYKSIMKRREKFGDSIMDYEKEFIEWIRRWLPS